MKIAIVAPSPVPFVMGGAENIYAGLLHALNQTGVHQAELIKLPTKELSFWALIDSYYAFASLDLDHFDAVISLKYPAWMVSHPRHIVYIQHKLRGFYDMWNLDGTQSALLAPHLLAEPAIASLWDFMARAEQQTIQRVEALLHLRLLLDRLRRTSGLPEDACIFPGPLIRRIVHFLDGVALRPSEIHAYYAISRVVAERPSYFPLGAKVRVLHHPSSLPEAATSSKPARAHIFTVSRLDKAKRIDLLIDAFMRSQSSLPLLIAGTGPEEAALRRLAAPDPRIRFLGFVDAPRLTQLYVDAAMVLFAPKDEDFGLVAWEAMSNGVPVITTHDAGGCTEIVTHDVDGLVVAPEASILAEAIGSLMGDAKRAQALGEAARARAALITWPRLVDELLKSLDMQAAPALLVGRRPRVTVLSTYPVSGVKSGGAQRIFHMYDRLRQVADIDLLVFDSRATQPSRKVLGKGLNETICAAELEYRRAEQALSAEAEWAPISDSAFPLLCAHANEFRALAATSCAESQAVVLEHPFLLPSVPEGPTPLIYDAHNMEASLKHQIYKPSRIGRILLDSVTTIEHEACFRADEIWACTADDRHLLTDAYRVPAERFVSVANGVDTKRIRFVAPADRARRRRQYGGDPETPVIAAFVGSWHGPNIDAAQRVIDCAWYLADIRFVIAGSVCDALPQRRLQLPRNVVLVGALDDAASLALLSTCDMALNPMRGGSGSNLKMFEYCAAGAPVVTTATGARGTDLRSGTHVVMGSYDCFEEAIIAAWADTPERRAQRSIAARRHVEQHFDWDVIVDTLLRESPTLAALGVPPACP